MPRLIAKTKDVWVASTGDEVIMTRNSNLTIFVAWITGFITAISAIIIWAML